jgi:hypothetical protein
MVRLVSCPRCQAPLEIPEDWLVAQCETCGQILACPEEPGVPIVQAPRFAAKHRRRPKRHPAKTVIVWLTLAWIASWPFSCIGLWPVSAACTGAWVVGLVLCLVWWFTSRPD